MIEENITTQRWEKRGMKVFILVWLGQLVSLLGSGFTGFALGVWVYQHTHSVTQFALISLCMTLPAIVISPIAGALVDRWDRRWTMLLSDCGAGLCSLILALIVFTSQLEVWHIYVVTFANSVSRTFQLPAYTATTTLLVPKEQLGRASGLIYLGQSASQLLSPVLGGVLLVTIQIQGVIVVDFATFLFAVVTLLLVRFPKVKTTAVAQASKSSLWNEVVYGWTYITARSGLLGLLIFLAINNFLTGTIGVLATPLVLSFASAAVLGIVLSISGSGMLIGSIMMSAWGGGKHLMTSIFSFMVLSGLSIVIAGLRASASLFAFAIFVLFFGLPIVNGSIQVIFQRKVPAELQGRVFALVGTVAGASLPLAYVIAGPLADGVFKPLLLPNGPLARSVGQIIGVGPGRGIGLMFIVTGILVMLVTMIAYQYPSLRQLEEELPDAIAGSLTEHSKN